MLPRKKRLPSSAFGTRIGRTVRSTYFLLKVFPNNNGHNRFGIIISKDALKKATERHFWKRQFAAQLREWPNLEKDFLIIASPKIKTADKKAIAAELKRILTTMNREPLNQ